MNNKSRTAVGLAALALVLLSADVAQAQYYGQPAAQPAPLYPYAVQSDQPYAVQVAPNTYVIQRPANTRAYPYVKCRNGCAHQAANPPAAPAEPRFDRKPQPADPALIEELRQRSAAKRTVINTTKIVRDPPVVIEHKRVVDDPPRVIERRHVVEDAPAQAGRKEIVIDERATGKHPGGDDGKKRVIEADAEVTILGPDRMSIRLFRKGQRGTDSNARAQ